MPEKYTFNLHNGGKFQLTFEPSDTIERVKEYFFENFGPSFDPKKLRLVTAGKIMQNAMSLSHYIESPDAGKPAEILVINANPPKDLLHSILQKYSIAGAPVPTSTNPPPTNNNNNNNKIAEKMAADGHDAGAIGSLIDKMGAPSRLNRAGPSEAEQRADFELGKKIIFEAHKHGVDSLHKDFMRSLPKIDMLLMTFNNNVLVALLELLKSIDERVLSLILRAPAQFIELYNRFAAEIKAATPPNTEAFQNFLVSYMGMLQYQAPEGAHDGHPPQPPVELDEDKFDQLLSQSNMSTDDKAAIIRISELGFSKLDSFQAYLACGKNEDLAANFLLNDSDRK